MAQEQDMLRTAAAAAIASISHQASHPRLLAEIAKTMLPPVGDAHK